MLHLVSVETNDWREMIGYPLSLPTSCSDPRQACPIQICVVSLARFRLAVHSAVRFPCSSPLSNEKCLLEASLFTGRELDPQIIAMVKACSYCYHRSHHNKENQQHIFTSCGTTFSQATSHGLTPLRKLKEKKGQKIMHLELCLLCVTLTVS